MQSGSQEVNKTEHIKLSDVSVGKPDSVTLAANSAQVASSQSRYNLLTYSTLKCKRINDLDLNGFMFYSCEFSVPSLGKEEDVSQTPVPKETTTASTPSPSPAASEYVHNACSQSVPTEAALTNLASDLVRPDSSCMLF